MPETTKTLPDGDGLQLGERAEQASCGSSCGMSGLQHDGTSVSAAVRDVEHKDGNGRERVDEWTGRDKEERRGSRGRERGLTEWARSSRTSSGSPATLAQGTTPGLFPPWVSSRLSKQLTRTAAAAAVTGSFACESHEGIDLVVLDVLLVVVEDLHSRMVRCGREEGGERT